MTEERMILQMVQNGRVTVQEAERLLAAIESIPREAPLEAPAEEWQTSREERRSARNALREERRGAQSALREERRRARAAERSQRRAGLLRARPETDAV